MQHKLPVEDGAISPWNRRGGTGVSPVKMTHRRSVMSRLPNLLALASLAVVLSACGHNVEQRAATGAVTGAVLGGPVGAAAGAAVGTVVSKSVDK